MDHTSRCKPAAEYLKELTFLPKQRIHRASAEPDRGQTRMSAAATLSEAVTTAVSSLPCEHVLHVFPSFGIGGVPLRMVRVINHLGKRFRHTVIALDNNFDAAVGVSGDLNVTLLPAGAVKRGMLSNLAASAVALRRLRPNLLLTYNWGAIEWAAAARFASVPRHLHLEAGFGRGEADSQIPRRVLFRRWALARCRLVVVPSRQLENLARHVWRLPAPRVAYIPNGVDTARFAAPVSNGVPGLIRRPGETVIGTVAPLRPEKNIGRLLRVFAMLDFPHPLRLVIAGDGAERVSLDRLAIELGIADRVIFTGQIDPASVLGAFDIFALSSDTEQMPNALLEAMAASRAIAAVDVGDVRNIVCEDNREFIVDRDDASAFAAALTHLLSDPERRRALGCANRRRVAAEFSQERMFRDYSRIFSPGRAP
jgi:glycosyltransferase involved in cell wall biosynthesis